MRSTHQLIKTIFMLLIVNISKNQVIDLPSIATLDSPWMNNGQFNFELLGRPFLFRNLGPQKPCYFAGFFNRRDSEGYLFSVVLTFQHESGVFQDPQIIWCGNRGLPIGEEARLDLIKSNGTLILTNFDDTVVWSSSSSVSGNSSSVAGLNLTESGNLVLFDTNNSTVWQSFDHPSDTLISFQKLVPGQKVISSVSDSDSARGLYSLSVTQEGVFASIESSNVQEPYYQYLFSDGRTEETYFELRNGSLGGLNYSFFGGIPLAFSTQFLQMRPDGRLKVYGHQIVGEDNGAWREIADVFANQVSECSYPIVCGRYGICKDDKQCSCPISSDADDSRTYFRPVSDSQPSRGCSPITELTCNDSMFRKLIKLENVGYFHLSSDIKGTMDQCKEACLQNCSCKVAVFYPSNDSNSLQGDCSLSTEVFSLMGNRYSYSSFIKVQMDQDPNLSPPTKARKNNQRMVVGITVGGLLVLFVVVGGACFIVKKKKRHSSAEKDQDNLDHVVGMLLRFTYNELRSATDNFNKKLGQGGFGSVFEGVLRDGTKIAVKHLHGVGQVQKSFLTEVESIGSIHHVNLARLIGFSVDKFHRFLVYEYMKNGSLDRWIYNKENTILSWDIRRKIIKDVAKGLAYLHEECRQKIIHLDVKPQNILLDEEFNAKLSDFGLAKLIDKNESKVVTNVRGTAGYLAPEWLKGVLTDKVDVYSFGIVMLEIICGRKQLEESEPEDFKYLLSVFKIKAEDQNLLDLVDKNTEDMQAHGIEAVKMLQLAAWCLQSDRSMRPSMSMVVKVLEGTMDVDENIDYSLLNTKITTVMEDHVNTTQPPSVLTGPR
ncbi:hypothetical protein Leryth_019800 [Lithospermum erythrorhizon]|nr:hypothetical protein Leryth_019800 [Lithospermum erythrorhizon]